MKQFIIISIVFLSHLVWANASVEAVSNKSLISRVNFDSPAITVQTLENQKVLVMLQWAVLHHADNSHAGDPQWLDQLSQVYHLSQIAVLALTFDQTDCMQNKINCSQLLLEPKVR